MSMYNDSVTCVWVYVIRKTFTHAYSESGKEF